jgi:hypothetical protein
MEVFEPVGRGESDGIFAHHGGQAGKHICEVFLEVDAQMSAVFDVGVKDDGEHPEIRPSKPGMKNSTSSSRSMSDGDEPIKDRHGV